MEQRTALENLERKRNIQAKLTRILNTKDGGGKRQEKCEKGAFSAGQEKSLGKNLQKVHFLSLLPFPPPPPVEGGGGGGKNDQSS